MRAIKSVEFSGKEIYEVTYGDTLQIKQTREEDGIWWTLIINGVEDEIFSNKADAHDYVSEMLLDSMTIKGCSTYTRRPVHLLPFKLQAKLRGRARKAA